MPDGTTAQNFPSSTNAPGLLTNTPLEITESELISDENVNLAVNNKPVAVTENNYILLRKYGFSVGIVAVALLVSFALRTNAAQAIPYLLFVIAITVSTWYGGLKPGLLSTILSGFAIGLFLVSSSALYQLQLIESAIPIILLLIIGGLISFIVDKTTQNTELAVLRIRDKEYHRIISLHEETIAKQAVEIKARDEFLSIASHELKTPLTSMLLQLQTALHSIRNVSLANFSVEKLMVMLENAEGQTTRLSKMINDLLNVSLITTGRMDLNIQSVNLSEVVKNVIESFSERLTQENYSVDLQLEEAVSGKWDKVRIEQVITNLVSNAIKYGNHKPITIIVKNHGSKALLQVIDQGIGIPADQHQRIFARFERGSQVDKVKGLGIGLYITQQIITAHGGTIAITSKTDSGSKFTVELPTNNPLSNTVNEAPTLDTQTDN